MIGAMIGMTMKVISTQSRNMPSTKTKAMITNITQ